MLDTGLLTNHSEKTNLQWKALGKNAGTSSMNMMLVLTSGILRNFLKEK